MSPTVRDFLGFVVRPPPGDPSMTAMGDLLGATPPPGWGGGGGSGGVPPGWVDVTAAPYNADKTGGADVTAAVNSAITAVNAGGNGGGTVYFPPGVYLVSTGPISMNGCQGVRLQGAGPVLQHNTGASILRFTGSAGHLLTMYSTASLTPVSNELTGLRFDYTNTSFTGDLVDIDGKGFGDVQNNRITECSFHAGGAGITARSFVRISQAVINYIDYCQFRGAQYGIRLADAGGPYVNVQYIEDCCFNTNVSAHIFIGTADGENIVIRGNTFESYQAVHGATVEADGALCGTSSFVFESNWMGDGGTGDWIYGVTVGQAPATVRGNYFYDTAGHHIVFNYGSWLIDGNYFSAATSACFSQVHPIDKLVEIANTYNLGGSAIFDSTFPIIAPGQGGPRAPSWWVSWGRSFGGTNVQPWHGFKGKLGIIDEGSSTLNSAVTDGYLIQGVRQGAQSYEPGIAAAMVYGNSTGFDGGTPQLVHQAPVTSAGNGTVALVAGATAAPVVQAGVTGGTPRLGFFTAATSAAMVSQAARAGQLTDSTGGTVSGTLAAGITDTVAKNAIASLAAKVNALEAIIHNLGLSA